MKLKGFIAGKALDRMRKRQRHTQGFSLRTAETVALVYKSRDEEHYLEIRALAKQLKDSFGLKTVMRFAYVPSEAKKIPAWHMKKLEDDFLCKSDLNWYGRPVWGMRAFCREPYDILIDLEHEKTQAIQFIVQGSEAKMKVGPSHATEDRDYDILMQRAKDESWTDFNQRLISFLANTTLT